MAKAKKKSVSKSSLKAAVKPQDGESLKEAAFRVTDGEARALVNQWLDNKAEGKRSKRNLARRIHRPKSNSTASKTGGKKKG